VFTYSLSSNKSQNLRLQSEGRRCSRRKASSISLFPRSKVTVGICCFVFVRCTVYVVFIWTCGTVGKPCRDMMRKYMLGPIHVSACCTKRGTDKVLLQIYIALGCSSNLQSDLRQQLRRHERLDCFRQLRHVPSASRELVASMYATVIQRSCARLLLKYNNRQTKCVCRREDIQRNMLFMRTCRRHRVRDIHNYKLQEHAAISALT
jgi:hypothetical protein